MLIKCKMCGFDIEVNEGQSICECEVCHSKQTVPTLDSDNKIGYFNRANLQRIRCEFDKAIEEYNLLIERFPNDPEAYWGKCLASYGIEYVDDPKTNKKIPTCHRTKEESILINKDYLKVLENCNEESKAFYEKEAKEIDRLQKEIISLSSKEEAYDIFICYKETDNNGNRTIDSVIAQEIYDKLVEKGYKVFFARRTLEKKLGLEYEPIIFAALRSAKAMLVIGTSIENFNAIWVKNEWSRYLEMMKKDSSKNLIPCYKNIDAYDMPLEFVSLQSQDLSKVGYMQDLIYGLDKIINTKKEEFKENLVINPAVSKLIKRAKILIENEEFSKANEILENVLNNDPENSKAYILKLLIQFKLKNEKDLISFDEPLDNYKLFNIAYKLAKGSYKNKLDDLLNKSKENYSYKNNLKTYEGAIKCYDNKEYKMAISLLKTIADFKDSEVLLDNYQKEYENAVILLSNKVNKLFEEKDYEQAVIILKEHNFNDEKLLYLYNEAKNKLNDKNKEIYNKAIKCQKEENYIDAINLYSQILSYKDTKNLYDILKKKMNDLYFEAIQLMHSISTDDLQQAENNFKKLGSYKDSKLYLQKCKKNRKYINISIILFGLFLITIFIIVFIIIVISKK